MEVYIREKSKLGRYLLLTLSVKKEKTSLLRKIISQVLFKNNFENFINLYRIYIWVKTKNRKYWIIDINIYIKVKEIQK